MSFNAAALQLMLDKGMTLKDVAEIAAAMESRSKGAERQSRYRKRKASVTNGDVTGYVTPPLNERISKPPVSSEPDGSPETPPAPKSNGKAPPAVSPEQVVEAWNTMAGEAGVPKARLTPERRRKLNTFVRRHTTDDITEAIWAVPRSPFLCGENDRGWKADLDFLLSPAKFTKILEGTYDRSTH